MTVIKFLGGALFAGCLANAVADDVVWPDQLELKNLSFPESELHRYLAANDAYAYIPGGFFASGIGMPSPGSFDVDLGGLAKSMTADCAIHTAADKTSAVVFILLGDGREIWRSGVRRYGDAKMSLNVDLSGVKRLTFKVDSVDGCGACRHACWGKVRITYPDGAGCLAAAGKSPQLGVLTPQETKQPRVNGARVYGVRPGRPVIFRASVTGALPMDISVEGLDNAPGLMFDPRTRTIGGTLGERGDYPLVIVARNGFGSDRKPLTIRCGDEIALTPPMGWNSWNAYGEDVSAEKILLAADTLIKSGLADHGWGYVNIDDVWANSPKRAKEDLSLSGPARDSNGTIVPNARFPDMKALVDRVHSLGLKAGIYSSPGPTTCAECVGSFGHEESDAGTFVRWGFDYLKYDWCSYKTNGRKPDCYIYPFLKMGAALRAADRDVVYSFNSGSGIREPSLWGRRVFANCWRISGDVFDAWLSISTVIEMSKRLYHYSSPGGWNDPDMLCVGNLRYGKGSGVRLTPNEQYTHMSMWALFAAPMMIGCDLTRMDGFTRSLLTNDEVLEIDQDELGLAAACIEEGPDWEIWARPLADKSIAVGLYNRSPCPQRIVFDMEKAGMLCKWRIRDCWRQEDVGIFSGGYEAEVFGHATHLIRLYPLPCGKLRPGLEDIRDAAWRLGYEKHLEQVREGNR